ncbi:glycosyltransferase, group 1 family protein [Alloprevotella tannerae ATCC 51259]|uniref:Glycosyltransferase, group 1 family protein n=2 Tax=Alloprevotella tannerae TaxID=76122 RepID=C9LKD8_9BACT|nr:glycosyltransferase, group 1 family protein [Alloprevotella tannerae ATCC 51259]
MIIMKKRILFMIGTLQSGGVSKSIVNLLNVMDRTTYDVHLLLLDRAGDILSPYLPSDITVHVNREIENLHRGLRGVRALLFTGHLLLAFGSLLRMLMSKISRAWAGRWLAYLMPRFTDLTFDLIIDYGGQQQLYYMVDKLDGKKKITFFHNDYSKWPYYYAADRLYYPKVDQILSISQTCVDVLKAYFPDCKDKISVMQNISSPVLITKQANETVDLPIAPLLLVSLGHIMRRKGTDFSIDAAKILQKKGVEFKWMLVGKVVEKDLIRRIEQEGLADRFVVLGIRSNPYPYIKAADIYVHPARFEGKSIALDEAKILCKPIIVTNFSTVNDQFEDRVNASICEMNGDALADAIIELAANKELRQSYVAYLNAHIVDNSSEVEKLYAFID